MINEINKEEFKQVIVVTGASAGVGRAIVREFSAPGVAIGLLARGKAGLEAACQEVERAGGKALVIPCDVGEYEQVEAAAAQMEETFGRIDLWINNAMASVFSPIKEMTPEEFKRVTDVTYLGYVYGTMAALKRMQKRDQGMIVHIGSALAYRGIPLQSAYCAAKHAVQGFHESLIAELMHDKSNVKVSMIQLPAVNTPQFRWVKSRLPNEGQPVPPIFQPEMIAKAVRWAVENNPREMFVGFPAVKAIQGNKIAPWYADWELSRMGYKSQQTQEPRDKSRPDNLWQPQDDQVDHGAHGVFDNRAKNFSLQLWASMNRGKLALASTAGIAALVGSLFLRKSR